MESGTILTVIISVISGGVGLEVIKQLFGLRKGKAEAIGAETESYGKLKKLIEDTLEKNAAQAKEISAKDATIAQDGQQIGTLKMMLEVANGVITKNNEFMKEVLIGWGEMKKSEEVCQKRVGELELRVLQLEGNSR